MATCWISPQRDSDRDDEEKYPRKSEEIYLSSGEEGRIYPWDSPDQAVANADANAANASTVSTSTAPTGVAPSGSGATGADTEVTSPHILLSVRDTGIDCIIVLNNLIAVGTRQAEIEDAFFQCR